MWQHTILTWRLISTIALFLFIFMPGSLATPFNGLPLTTLEALAFFILLIIIWTTPTKLTPLPGKIWLASLLVLIIWQGIGSALLPTGWGVCLQRQLEPKTLTTPCEPSAEIGSGDPYTFTTNHIDWQAKNYPLYFMNESPFSYTSESDPERSTMPYTLTATAYFEPSRDTDLIATTNTPNTILQVNDQDHDVPFDEEFVVTLPANQVTGIRLTYTAPHADSNSINLTTQATPFHEPRSNLPGSFLLVSYQLISFSLLATLAFLALLIIYSHLKSLSPRLRHTLFISSLVVLGAYLTNILTASVFIIAALIFILLHVFAKKPKQLLPFTLIGLICFSMIYANIFRPLDILHLMDGGGDQITHTTHARSLLKAEGFKDILIADEPRTFYFQALYRYHLATTFKFLGEAIWAPTVTQTFLLLLALWYGAKTIWRLGGPVPTSFFALVTYLSISLFDNHPLKLAATSYQEALGISLFIITILYTINAWTSKKTSLKQFFFVSLMWGLTISTRNNLLPAAAMLIIFFLARAIPAPTWPIRFKQILSMAAGFIIFPLIIMTRNLIVDGQANFLTSSLHPNLIDPFRPLFPGIGGASDLTFMQALSTITDAYQGRLSELFSILWLNLQTNYIGLTELEQNMWIVFLFVAAYLLIRKSLRIKITTLMILAITLLPMVFGAFFMHRAIAAQSHSHLVLAVSLSILLAYLISPTKSDQSITPPPPG